MDTQPPVMSLEENLQQAVRRLPPAIRDYLAQGKATAVAKNLIARYGLRIDQGGVLEREIMLLLMGVDMPDEFIQTLSEEAKLDRQTVNNIVRDVNDQIFVPLREEIQKGGGTPPAKPPTPPSPLRPTGPWPHRPQPSMPRPQVYAPPPQSPRYVSAAESQLPAGMKFATPSREMAGIKKEKSVNGGPPVTPLQQALRAVTPPQNLPEATLPPAPPSPPTPPPPPAPVRKSGDTDPYREPIG